MVTGPEPHPSITDETANGRRGFLAWMGRAGIVVAGGIAGLVSGGAPSAAHPVSSGWSDNHTICSSCTYRTGGIVRLWQQLLWSANVSGTPSNCGNWVDGIFGPATATATRNWQRTRRLQVDGIVGKESWTTMRAELYQFADSNTHWKFAYPHPNNNEGRRLTNLQQSKSTGVWTFQRCGSASWSGTSH